MGRRIATFVHISDLHIGELDKNSDDATFDAHTEDWLKKFPLFDGYLGHSGVALRHVDAFFQALRRREKAKLIVTGDLTTVGHLGEFALAKDYLAKFMRWPSGVRIGLNERDYAQRSIPGNHDHWPGRRALGAGDLVMFGPAPHAGSIPPAACPSVTYHHYGDVEVAFLRVNSDADVSPNGLHRLFARGSFSSQLSSLRTMLGPAEQCRQVRVLLVHHSPSHTGFTLGMSARMLADLESFLEDTDTRVVLSGHVHKPGSVLRQVKGHEYLEARCGTSTQRDTVPSGWAHRTLDPNTLLVHRLKEAKDGRLYWHVEVYARTSKGFATGSTPHFQGALAAQSVQVCP